MYRILVADDEESSFLGLSTMVGWASMRLELAGAYRTGEDVIRALENGGADVILTDIRMPGVTGVDIARYVWEAGMTTRVILLSGYKDFEYAQQAMRYDVRHYLTKPFLMDSLRTVVHDVLADLDDLSQRRTVYDHVVGRYQSIEAYMALQLFRDAACGGLKSPAAYERRAQMLELSEACVRRRCLLYELRSGADWLPEDAAEALQRAAVQLGAECYPVGRTPGGVAAVAVENPRFAGAVALLDALRAVSPLGEAGLLGVYANLRELAAAAPLSSDALAPAAPSMPQSGSDVIMQALRLIGSDFADDLTLSRVAARVHLSPVYLSRLFHEQTGRTFLEHLTRARMQAAARLLEGGRLPVYAVCDQVGYTDVKYFSKVFKASTGYTPSEYRERAAASAAGKAP